jgi:hypothetical protein
VSQSWAGYYATGGGFHSVTATWIEPDLTGPGTNGAGVLIWVGLDAEGDLPIEQIGTTAYSLEGMTWAWHQIWYRTYPQPGFLTPIAVNAGDQITATVTSLGNHRFRQAVTDDTTGKRLALTLTSRLGRGLSAEVIVESPSYQGRGLPVRGLADFAPVRFTACAFNGRPIGDSAWARLVRRISASRASLDAETSDLDAGGSGFVVSHP